MKHYLFLLLIPIVFISQFYLLQPHLKLGFDNTADEYVVRFRELRNMYPNLTQFIPKSLQEIPFLWINQYYYTGILNYFLGDNWVAYHQTAHFFKSLASLSVYPMFFVLTGNSLIAFVSSLIFAISYSSAGGLEDVVTAVDYIGIINLSLFFTVYFSLIQKKINSNLKNYLLGLILLLLSLATDAIRNFPIVFIILATEIFVLFRNQSTETLRQGFKRIAILLFPILIIVTLRPAEITKRAIDAFSDLYRLVLVNSKHELLLIPFLSFASTILPSDLWPPKTLILFSVITIVIGLLFSKHSWRFILITFLIWILGFWFVNWSWSTSSRQNLDDLKTKSVIGLYFLGLGTAFFMEWLQNRNKSYIGLFLGPFLSFTFILFIWLFTGEKTLVFVDINRYMAHASIFTSFFIGSGIVVFYQRLKTLRLFKPIAYSVFLLIPIYLFISSWEINKYFNNQFKYQFMTLQDQDTMRRKLLVYLSKIKRPGLIYIDTYSDPNSENGYYYRQIYYDGALNWLFWYDKSVNTTNVPRTIFNYHLLQSSVITTDGVKGISLGGVFFKDENFTAVKLLNRQVIDISDQTKKDLGLSE